MFVESVDRLHVVRHRSVVCVRHKDKARRRDASASLIGQIETSCLLIGQTEASLQLC